MDHSALVMYGNIHCVRLESLQISTFVLLLPDVFALEHDL
jgi:hypothetical protein